jgi:flagellar biogenesis protein FliO
MHASLLSLVSSAGLPGAGLFLRSGGAETGTDGPALTRYLIVCGVLIAAIAGLGFGFRRLVGGAVRARAARRSLAVLDVLPLGGKQRLAVVRCYDRTLVLGLGDRELGLLAEIDREVPSSSPAPAPVDAGGFAGVLKSLGAGARTARAPAPAAASRAREGADILA